MNKLSVTIITKNEEKNIKRCLKSVKWADEIIVVDSGSKDNTVKVCHDFGCRVIETDWRGFGKTKKYAVEQAKYDWIFSIDADEVVTDNLKNKIISILEDPAKKGYKIKRSSFYLGKKIKHCGWNRDYPLRLFNRQYGNFNEKIVHESVEINGDVGRIESELLHYTYPTIESHIERLARYSVLSAKQKYKKGKKVTITGAMTRGVIKFVKMYFFQLGFLDGKYGFLLSLNSSYGVFIKYLKLWEMNQK